MHLTNSDALFDDGMLAHLAARGHLSEPDEMPPETRDFLDHTMPGLCAELLAWRMTARDHPAELAMALRGQSLAEQLDNARLVALTPESFAIQELAAACKVIQRLAPQPEERAAATDVLHEIYGDQPWHR